MRKPHGEIEYGNLIIFFSVMASFPCSNALVERIFSCLKVVNNEKRSPMKSKNLGGTDANEICI